MADLKSIQDEIALDETPVAVPIFKKDGVTPYLADSGEQSSISVLGSDAQKVREAEVEIQRRALRGGKKQLTPEEILRSRVEKASAAITGWSGWSAGGVALPVSPENVKAMLAIPHILRQVEAGIEGHADFFTSASAT